MTLGAQDTYGETGHRQNRYLRPATAFQQAQPPTTVDLDFVEGSRCLGA